MKNIIKNFTKLTQIPHCSFDTGLMKDFLIDYAKSLNFKVETDKAGNILCFKGEPKICLQSHYDMVCMGDAPKIELFEEEGFLKAKNSSLGADNGIGVALMMEMMSKFENLECLFTNDEEVGLLGANGLELKIKSKRLLNLDHESESEVIIGCAGGVDISAKLSYDTKELKAQVFELETLGFKGGHSGMNIIDNVKSSIKEMAKFIRQNEGQVVEFNGGERINSIPKFAKALVCFKTPPKENKLIKCTFLGEKSVQICKQSDKLLSAINAFSQGVRSYSKKLNIVQSSINLSLLKMQDKKIEFELFARSNVLEELENLEFETREFFENLGFETRAYNFYPPWEGQENEFSTQIFEILKKHIKNAKILAVHAGLECGIIEKKQSLLCASIGPNIYNPHSTDERCELASVEKIAKVVEEILSLNQ